MPRARAILQSEFPYHITARCINREWFRLPMEDVWFIFCDEISKTIIAHELQVHSFVLMTNHFHLIASTPAGNISACMQRLMVRSSLRLARAGNRINETFAGRHFKSVLGSQNYFLNTYKYVYRNPVEAGLCERVEEYRYSTLAFVTGQSEPLFELVKDSQYESNQHGTLAWLNQPVLPEKLEAVRHALKHQSFKVTKARINRKPVLGANELI